MNDNKGAICLLLVILSIGSLIYSYNYVYKKNMDNKKQIESELVGLKQERDALEEQNRHKEEYEAEIKENTEFFYSQLEAYPGDLNQEASVMFMKSMEMDKGNLQYEMKTVGMGREEVFYTLGAPTNDEFGNAQYDCYTAEFPIMYEGSYEGLKQFVDNIMGYKYRMNISEMTIAYDAVSDVYSGNVLLNAYSVAGNGREGVKVDVNEEKGKNNPFLDGDGSSAVTTSSHDADNGDSIADSHDIEIDIVNANNDSGDGIVVSAGSSDSNVSSSANSVEDVLVKIEETEDKIVVTYSIGGSSYSFDLSGDEVDIFVKSSDRVDSDDANGVKLIVDNSTDVAVFVKVSGDDSSSPRFTLGSKTGTVKVY